MTILFNVSKPNLEFFSYLKEKKVKSKNEANQYQFKPVKKVPAVENLKKGKVFEGKKKKLTLLKNNMLREKKRQEQLLLALLNSKAKLFFSYDDF